MTTRTSGSGPDLLLGFHLPHSCGDAKPLRESPSPLTPHPILPSQVFVPLSPGRRCPPPGMLRLHSSSDKCLFIIPSSTETPAPQGLPRVPPRGSLAHSSLCAPKRPGPLLPTCPSQNFTVLFLIALWTNDSNSTHCTF